MLEALLADSCHNPLCNTVNSAIPYPRPESHLECAGCITKMAKTIECNGQLLGHQMQCILRIVVENGIIMDGSQDSIKALWSYTDIGAQDLQAADLVFMKEEMHVGCSLLDGLLVIEVMLRVEITQCTKENLTCCCDRCVF